MTQQNAAFRTVMRGYEPAEVDRAFGELRKALEQARAEAGNNSVAVTKLTSQVAQLEEQANSYRARMAALEQQEREAAPPSFNDLGARIGKMLKLAEDEAAELRSKARAEAEKLVAEAEAAAEHARTAADRYSADVTSKTDAESTRALEAAKRQSDEILDYADREATARREEAEAVYEHQRARAAAAAADFEKTLAERRDKAAAEFAVQMQANEKAIALAQERQAAIEAEADRTLAEARAQADSHLRAAREEAGQHVDAARLSAEKIRRESERELQAATSRRDSITAQLTNVRQMLATLGGASIVNPFSDPEPEAAAPPADEPVHDQDGSVAEAVVEGDTEDAEREQDETDTKVEQGDARVKFRYLGNSGLKVSEICYGNWLTHGSQVENETAERCVKAALEAGITSYDTADAYANTVAEKVLGDALKGERRESLEIFTKVYWPTGPKGPNDSGLSRKHIFESINGSLRRLRTDYVDLYQAHRYDHETPLEETMQAFADVVRQGKALYIGVSEWDANEIRAGHQLAQDLGFQLVSNQPQYSMLYRVIEEWVVPTSTELGLSQICWSPVAQGVLTGKYLPGEAAPKNSRATDASGGAAMIRRLMGEEVLVAVQRLRPIADELELTMAQLAVAWVLQNPNVACAIIGASKPRQINENVAASGVVLTPEVLSRIDDALGDVVVRNPMLTVENSPKGRPS